MSELSPESANPTTRPISSEYAVALAKKAWLDYDEQAPRAPVYLEDLSDVAKVYLLDLETTFRAIKDEIVHTGKTEGYVVSDILMTINDTLLTPNEYEYLIHYAWYMCMLNNINQREAPAPRHLKEPRHRRNILTDGNYPLMP